MAHLVFADIREDAKVGKNDSKGSINKSGANFATSGHDGHRPHVNNKQPDLSIGSTVSKKLLVKCSFCNGHHILVCCKDFKKLGQRLQFIFTFVQKGLC